ncbi:RagB/SusD family nutrient uptake outer membrane protein [Chitinophaga sp. Mgbs1]|uniref:RagB/SusD family nutrient uptake outer membrane protein n=1 Tax=Chitinophaga solisilvae TaxID=1233460 RepID=A0A3S1DNE2_9BACT|nr:RagB/SusD family nutrient uptake outer membrane protein [Chitinophaga solisilvae]
MLPVIFLLLGASLLPGCKKYLEQVPDNRTQLDSPEKVAQLLTSAYPDRDYYTFTETMSDNSQDRKMAASQYVGDVRINEHPFRYTDFDTDIRGSVGAYWQSCYQAIAAANQALEACDKHPGNKAYLPYKGEALMARAYAHFMLVSLFAKSYDAATAAGDPGIPYVKEPEKTLYKNYERKSVAYVYEMIDKDISEALPLLNDNAYKVPAFHFTRVAAHAFAARFYLFQKQYDKVITHVSQAFPGTTISAALRPLNTVYKAYTSDQFQNYYTSSSQKTNLLLATNLSVWSRGQTDYQYGFNQALAQQLLYSNNVTGGYWTYGDLTYYWGPAPDRRSAKKLIEKFIYTSADVGNPYVFAPLLTAEEALFNRAEANIQSGKYDAALTDLNAFISTRINNYDAGTNALTTAKVTSYYKTADTRQALINALLDIKRVEFIQEGMRWFDILRHRMTVTHTNADGSPIILTADDKRKVIQIPQSAQAAGIAANPR